MPNEELDGGEKQGNGVDSNWNSNSKEVEERDDVEKGKGPSSRENRSSDRAAAPSVLSIVISQPEEAAAPQGSSATDKDDKAAAAAAKKGCLPRSESYHEQCRVCQQQTDEPLIDLGCRCRGELAKAHRSCIDIWFHTRGSNKCEICQQLAANVPPPEAQPNANYWVWRVDPAFGGSNMLGQGEHERVWCSPLWVAFSIIIGGLLLDVLISVSLGVSELPVNIIIGVLVWLGLGTTLRLAVGCFRDWRLRRNIQSAAGNIANTGFHPAV